MKINNSTITRRQLKQVEAPNRGVAKRLEQTKAATVGGMCQEASAEYRSHQDNYEGLRNFAIGSTVVGGGLTAILAANGATGWATAIGCLGGAVALGTGYFAFQERGERDAWNRFYNDVQSWGGTAAQNLSRPGSEPGTVENHAFYEAGVFQNVFDVRKDGVVVARHVELDNGMKLREDVKAGTVTADTAAGQKLFQRASLELPTATPWTDSYYHREDNAVLKLTTWGPNDTKVRQTIDFAMNSNAEFNGERSMSVFPATTLAYGRTSGTELPDGLVRFEYGGNNQETEVLFAAPPLTGRDFKADFKLDAEATTKREFEKGYSIFRNGPAEAVAPNSVRTEKRANALLTNHIPLPGTGAELVETVATGQTNLVKEGRTVHTRQATLDVYNGVLREKDVTQDIPHYPAIKLWAGGAQVYIDSNDNIKAGSTPARLIDGTVLELGTGDKARQFEIPVPRKSW